jgi:hypothetical protein
MKIFLNDSHIGCRLLLYHLHLIDSAGGGGERDGPTNGEFEGQRTDVTESLANSKRLNWSSAFSEWVQIQLLIFVLHDRQIAFGGGGLFKNSDATIK